MSNDLKPLLYNIVFIYHIKFVDEKVSIDSHMSYQTLYVLPQSNSLNIQLLKNNKNYRVAELMSNTRPETQRQRFQDTETILTVPNLMRNGIQVKEKEPVESTVGEILHEQL